MAVRGYVLIETDVGKAKAVSGVQRTTTCLSVRLA